MTNSEQIARIRISLKDIEPEIWRLVEVPLGMHLKGLHDVIQAVMGWRDCHLFEFRIGEKRYGIPDADLDLDRKVLQAKAVRLAAFVSRGIERFDYIYDFGDNWEHAVVIETIADANPALKYPCFVAGARRGAPEDVGGPPGFFDFLEAVANPHHSEHQRLIEWYGGPYDPDDLDRRALRLRLGAIAKRYRAGKAAFAKSQLKS